MKRALLFIFVLFHAVLYSQSGKRISKLDWGTYFGGANAEYDTKMVVSNDGFVYITGWTESATHVATSGSHQDTLLGSRDAFIAKFDTTGSLIWGTYFGGQNEDMAYDIALDNSGNIYITGETDSDSGIATSGTHDSSYGSTAGYNSDAFLAKFSPNGNQLWGTYYGGSGNDNSYTLSLDDSANIYIHGLTNSTTDIATPGAHKTSTSWTTTCFFVAKFDSSGQRLWGTYYGSGSGWSLAKDCHVDDSSNVYVTGTTNLGQGISTIGAHQPNDGVGYPDAYLAKFSAQGVLLWGTYYGSWGSGSGESIASDEYGNVYLAGHTTADSQVATTGAHQFLISGGYDGFLVKFDPTGNRLWGTYYGGSGYDEVSDIAIVGNGHLFLIGSTTSDTEFGTWGAYKFIGDQSSDTYISVFDYNGVRAWSTYFGGSGNENGTSIGLGVQNRIYICGSTTSNDGIATNGTYQSSRIGSNDAYLARFHECWADSVAINVSACNSYNSPSGKYSWYFTGQYTDTLFNSLGCDSIVYINLTISAPEIDSVLGGQLCDSGSFTLFAMPQHGNVIWFLDSISSSPLDTGISYSTPMISSTQTFYISATDSGCTHRARWPIIAEVVNTPKFDSIIDGQRCGSGKLLLNAGVDSGTVYWFNTPTTGSLFHSGEFYQTPTLYSNRTYYVGAVLDGCATNRFPIKARVISFPTIDSTVSGKVCDSGTVTLSAFPSSGMVYWFSSKYINYPTIFSPIDSGSTFTTPALTLDSVYYAGALDSGCIYFWNTDVRARVDTSPQITQITNGSRCDSGIVLLQVQKSSGVVDWYEDSINNVLLHTGRNFWTPGIDSTKYFFAQARDSGCISVRRGVKATVNYSSSSVVSKNSCFRFVLPFDGDTIFSSGQYLQKTTNSVGCDSLITINLTIDTIEKGINANGSTLSATANSATYQWYDCVHEVIIQGENSKSFRPLKNGSYAVIVTQNNCVDTSGCIDLSWLGEKNSLLKNGITVYPNPTNDFLTIDLNQIKESILIELFDLRARKIKQWTFNDRDRISLTLDQIPGVYQLIVSTDQNTSVFKIVKK